MKKPVIIAALMALMLPLTAAAQQSLPISMDFENETAFAQWTLTNCVSSTGRTNSSNNAHDGSYLFGYHWSTQSNPAQYLISPEFTPAANPTQVSLWYMNGGNYVEEFAVGYSSTTADTSAFTWTSTVTVPGSTPWTEYTSIVPAGTKYVAIRSMAYDAYYLYIDDIYIGDAPTCFRVNSFAATQATTNEITLAWTDTVNSGATYTLYNMADSNVVASGISDTSYTVTGLTPNTAYTFGLEANCSATDASQMLFATVRTECTVLTSADLPYSQNFDSLETGSNSLIPCWNKLSFYGSYPGHPTVSTTGGRQCLYFYPGHANEPIFATLPAVDDLNGLMLSFSWLMATQATLQVGTMTDPADSSTFVPLLSIPAGNGTWNTPWTEVELSLTDIDADVHYVAFRAGVSSSWGYVYIDDVVLQEQPDCMRPNAVTVSDTAATSATLHIVDPVQAMNYVVVYGNDSITVVDTVVNLENLTPATAYTVRVYTLCSDGNPTPNFVSASFNTPCVNIAVSSTEPYVESFETWGTGFNQCWNRLSFDAYSDYFSSTGSYLPIVSSTMAHTGSNSMRMYSYYYEDYEYYDYDEYSSYAFMPVFESPVANLQMSFWYKVPAGIGDVSLAVGVSSTTSDSSTFVRLTTIVPADTAWHQYEVDLSAYGGDGNRITFYQSYDGEEADYMYGYIDDITVASLGECVRPSAVSVSELSATTATITWVDINQIGLYRVVINGDETSAMNAYDTAIYLTNLEADSTYTVAVSTICDGTPTEARTITFHTPCLPVAHDALPWSENFDGVVSSSSAPLEVGCMSFIRKENSYGSRYPYANSSTRYGDSGNSLYFSPGNGEHQMAILPLFDDELTSLMFSAQVYRSTTSNALLLGVMTNPNDPATFVTVDTLLPDTTNSWSYVEHNFADFEGTGSYIAIRPMNYLNSYTSLFIDNISVGEVTECQRVESVSVSAITATEVTLAWADSLQQGSYRVWLTSTADSNVFDEMVYDFTFTFTGLQPNTAYVAHVATICNGVATAPVDFGFITPCDAVDMPWSENFDEWTSKSTCWSFLSGAFNGGNGPATTYASAWTLSSSSYGSHITLDGKALTMNVYGTNRFWAVTPTINISSPDAMLSADVAVAGWSNATPNYDANDTLAFAISTDGGSTFTTLSVLGSAELNALGSSYTTVEVPVSGYDGQAVRFAIFAGSTANGGDSRIVIDNVTVDEAPSCMRPSGVTVSNIADVSATVTISDSTLAGSYHMVIVSGADTIVDQTLTDTVYTVNTLLPNSDYTVMVSTLCDDNSESTVFSTGFHTLCEIQTMPWSENFDSWSVRSDCWSFLSGAYNGGNGPAATSTTTWNLGNTYGNHITIDGKALYMNVYGTTSFWAVTPAVNITDNNAMLSADVAVAGWSSATPAYDANDTLAFAISTDGGVTFTTLSVLDNNALNALGNAYTSIEVPVIGYNGQQVRFAIFAGSTAAGGDNRIVVDNVAVGVLSSCMRPSSVSVSDITDVSATVAISDSTQVGSYHLVIVSGTDTVVDQTLTDTVYTVTSLQPSTDYSVKVSALCSDGTETPAASASFRTLCGTMEMPWTESFDSWTVKSDCWSFLSGAYNGGNGTPTASTSAWILSSTYGNDIAISGKALTMNVYSTYCYWAVTPAVNITSDNAVLSVDVAVAAWSNATPNYDANDTLAFAVSTDDGASFTNLMVLDSAALNALDTAYTSVEVPVSGYNGQQVRFAIFAGSTAAGGDNRIAIDNVSVTADTNAPQPEMYTVSAASADAAMGSATVSATRVAAGTSVTATATANSGYHFTNWTAAGTVVSTANPYTFTVSADIALTANFEADGTEPEECVDPTDVAASDVTATSATISWTAGGSETRWAIDWGTGADTTANNPYTLTGLEPNTTYYVKVKALCADGNESGWSSPATFTTATVGIDGVDAAAISLYPNPATTTATISGISGQATVTVVDMNGREVHTQAIKHSSNQTITLDLTGYAQGAYFVRIVGEQQSAVRKLIVK